MLGSSLDTVFVTLFIYLMSVVSCFSEETLEVKTRQLPLQKVLIKQDLHDTAVKEYVVTRCMGNAGFFITLLMKSGQDYKGYADLNSGFFELAKLFRMHTNMKRGIEEGEESIIKDINDTSSNMMMRYVHDSNDFWEATGSRFVETYIEEDLNICVKLWENVKSFVEDDLSFLR